jgi:DNA-binding protein WhiA
VDREISFSAQVKEELAHLQPGQSCCARMELAGLLRGCGRIALGGQARIACTLATDHAAVARKAIRLIRSEFGLQTRVLVVRRRRLRKNLSYRVKLLPQVGLVDMLQEMGVMDGQGHLHEWGELVHLHNDHCRRAYLRGTFLGTGWISSPERQHHLEMTTVATEAADQVGQLLFRYGIAVRMAARKESLILYLKESEQIVRFLSLIGAHHSLFKYEDVRAMKEMKNHVNRQVNAETANLEKTAAAAARQTEALERLRSGGALERLPAPLKELATLRLNHPDASLKELGEMCMPSIGKSGVNHRMRQLMKIAEPFV